MNDLTVEQDITNACIERLIFGHLLVGHEVDRSKSLSPCFGFGERKKLAANAGALSRRVDRYAIEKESVIGHEQFKYAQKAPPVFRNVDLTPANHDRIVLEHWPRLFPDTFDVTKIGSANTSGNRRHVGCGGCANDDGWCSGRGVHRANEPSQRVPLSESLCRGLLNMELILMHHEPASV
jgi:hypothetical protein